jgi:hypothetical protein
MTTRIKLTNCFSLGAQIGGPDIPVSILQEEQQLRDAMNGWRGEYTSAVREFAFLLRVDGSIHSYTKMWDICGAQKAKRKRDWIEVEIGVPESWWQDEGGKAYKRHLAAAIEEGLHSMIEVLQGTKVDVKADALLSDWEQIKAAFLSI